MIHAVPAEGFREIYPHVERFFRSFYERAKGSVAAGALEVEILQKKRQCYVAVIDEEVKACALSYVDPAGNIVLDFCAGEDAAEWQEPLIEMFEEWRASKGVRLTIICRPGWVRRLKMRDRGYREAHKIMELG